MTYLLSNCSDFKQQKTDIEQLCDELCFNKDYNMFILFTPKYHCELAGEGIEYTWGASKRYYRKEPLAMKKQSKDFKLLVTTCIEKIDVAMARKFSRKARSYMLAYMHQKIEKENNLRDNNNSFYEIEKLQKCYRGHRDANCFDGRFIEEVMKQSILSNTNTTQGNSIDSLITQPDHDN